MQENGTADFMHMIFTLFLLPSAYNFLSDMDHSNMFHIASNEFGNELDFCRLSGNCTVEGLGHVDILDLYSGSKSPRFPPRNHTYH